MNILVYRLSDQAVYSRPDTTLERESKVYYIPEEVDCLYKVPVLFVRICRAGKCIGEKFAERYYDRLFPGVLLYAGDPASPETIAFGSQYDKSSYIDEGNALDFYPPQCIAQALSLATRKQSVRIGDMLAIEYDKPERVEFDGQAYISY
jgi:hypothetical protein